MYIPEFWAGVLATLLIEVVGIITTGVVSYIRDKNKKG